MPQAFESLFQLVFFSIAIALVLLERVGALQRERVAVASRWASNVGLYVIGNVVSAIALPAGIFAFAAALSPGVVARLPFATELLLTFVVLDFALYWQHRLLHHVSLLWRLHLVHHSDTQIDVTTSERHHPLELLFSTAVLVALVAALRLPAEAVGVYLICASAVSLISHANLRMPAWLDRALNRVIVTPPVHAVHHSDRQSQTDSNYGSVLTIWDRWFGTYADPRDAAIAHFGLAYFHRPEDTRLGRVLRQPFVYRRDLPYPARDDSPPGAAATTAARRSVIGKASTDALIGALAGSVLVMIVMWPTANELMQAWRSEPYQYAWLVLPMLAYMLVWHPRAPGDAAVEPRPDFTGVPVVVAAALGWVAAELMNINLGREIALVLSLHGVAMSALGWRAYRRLFPTLALTFLMIPCGDVLQPVLRTLTLRSIEAFAALASLPHSVDGFVIRVGASRYIVIDDCSGLAYVTLAMFLGYCFGLLIYRSLRRIVALAVVGAALGIAANVIRVNAIVLVDWTRGTQMDLGAHGAFQWAALIIALGVLFYVLSRLAIEEAPGSADDGPERTKPLRKLAPVVAGVCGLLVAGGVAALPPASTRPPDNRGTPVLPQVLAGWTRDAAATSWRLDAGGTRTMRASYRRDGRELELVVVDAWQPAAKLGESALAPGDPTLWREKLVHERVACARDACTTLLHSAWQRDRSDDTRHAYFAYAIGGAAFDSRLTLRAVDGWHRLVGDASTPRVIGFLSAEPVTDVAALADAFDRVRAALDTEDAR